MDLDMIFGYVTMAGLFIFIMGIIMASSGSPYYNYGLLVGSILSFAEPIYKAIKKG